MNKYVLICIYIIRYNTVISFVARDYCKPLKYHFRGCIKVWLGVWIEVGVCGFEALLQSPNDPNDLWDMKLLLNLLGCVT